MNYWSEGNHQNPKGPTWPMMVYFVIIALSIVVGVAALAYAVFIEG